MRKAFEIPTIDEIKIHMQAKKPDWPASFVAHYAERFWMKYQSQGWKLSNNVAMKDWKAAFSANWQTLKYQEDIQALASARLKQKPVAAIENHLTVNGTTDDNLKALDNILGRYKKHPTTITHDVLASCYDYLKQMGVTKWLSQEEMKIAVETANKNVCKGKAIAVQFIFDKMAMRLKTFSELVANV